MLPNRTVWPKIALGISMGAVAGALVAFLSLSGVRDWYPTLIKPPWSPPSWAFAPLWLLLFVLSGAALGLVWATGNQVTGGWAPRTKRALVCFWVQLALHVAWSAAFFGARSPGWGYAVIILLWLAVFATLWIFSKIARAAGWLLVPYFAWVTFASALNFGILSLNVLRPTVQQMDDDPRNGDKDMKPGATLR